VSRTSDARRTGLNSVAGVATSDASADELLLALDPHQVVVDLANPHVPERVGAVQDLAPGREVDVGIPVADRLVQAQFHTADGVDDASEPTEGHLEVVVDRDPRDVAHRLHQARRAADGGRHVDPAGGTVAAGHPQVPREGQQATSPRSTVMMKIVSVRSPPTLPVPSSPAPRG
jgi:hypothetical protein